MPAGGWRIYELGISYAGRTYAEGKKVGWKDGVRAMYCIIRYSKAGERVTVSLASRPSVVSPASFGDADEELQATLHSLDGAREYADWIYGLIEPHVGSAVLEIGAGYGLFTEQLARTSKVTATDSSERCVANLRRRFLGDSSVDVRQADLSEAASTGQYDSVVLVNVLEHVEDT